MTPAQRAALIQRYQDGPGILEAALAKVPSEALKFRPAPGKWTVHEVIIHCADSETNSHMRIRYLLGEDDALIVGYDQDRWANVLGYHDLPLEPALATVRAVRANTMPLLRRLTEEQWKPDRAATPSIPATGSSSGSRSMVSISRSMPDRSSGNPEGLSSKREK
jgi:hypothetical protein